MSLVATVENKRPSRWLAAPTFAAAICLVFFLATRGTGQDARLPKPVESSALRPVAEVEKPPELALLMGDLQRLTHKMALSAYEGNTALAAFYMHESIEQLKAIQEYVPEYEGQPVAMLIDRLGLPAYEQFKDALAMSPPDKDRLLAGLDLVIQSCNQCHVTTKHQVIKIIRGTEVNPYNQSFKP
jgi:hypothetical protein